MTGNHSSLALGRLKVGRMNKTEAEYAALLEQRRRAGEVEWFKFEGMKFRLGDNCHYTPDFAVMLAGGRMQMHEVKGFWRDDAKVKIKSAAENYPFQFIAVRKQSKKAGGGFAVEEF